MDRFEQNKWSDTRRKGFTRYVIRYTVMMLLLIVGVDILSVGVEVAIDKGSWNRFTQDVQAVRWLRSLGLTAFLGLAAGVYSWYSKERAYKSQPSR